MSDSCLPCRAGDQMAFWCILMNAAPFSHFWDRGLFPARWMETGFILIDMERVCQLIDPNMTPWLMSRATERKKSDTWRQERRPAGGERTRGRSKRERWGEGGAEILPLITHNNPTDSGLTLATPTYYNDKTWIFREDHITYSVIQQCKKFLMEWVTQQNWWCEN